jgi:DNA polymerase III epsilon subunit-like protein
MMSHDFILSCDLETTSDSPSNGDWITGSFAVHDFHTMEVIRELELRSRPNVWSEEAFLIHKIRHEVAKTFPDRRKALEDLVAFLPPPRSFMFLCHANTVSRDVNREYKDGVVYHSPMFVHFDFACLKMDFWDTMDIFEFRRHFNDRDVYSTWTMAHDLIDRGTLPRGLDLSLKDGLCRFFGIPLEKHHDARADRMAMVDVFRRLRDLDGTIRRRDPELNLRTPTLPGTRRSEDQQRFSI